MNPSSLGLSFNSKSLRTFRIYFSVLTPVNIKPDLDVAIAHVVFVTLQRQVSVLHVDEANQGFAVSPALSVETQGDATSGTQE